MQRAFHLHIFRKGVYVFIPPQHSALAPIGSAGVKRYRDHKAVLYGVLEADLSAATLLTASLERTDNGSPKFPRPRARDKTASRC